MRSSDLVLVLVVLCVLLTTAGCAANPAPANFRTRAAAEDDVAAAVFRYLFDHNASRIQQRAATYCLSLPGERMPGAEFLQRFAGHQPPVAAADRCARKSGVNLFFRVQKLDWRKDTEVWVRGGYWEANLSSATELFRVVYEGGEWVVKGARTETIS
jgi:hypothetical protein